MPALLGMFSGKDYFIQFSFFFAHNSTFKVLCNTSQQWDCRKKQIINKLTYNAKQLNKIEYHKKQKKRKKTKQNRTNITSLESPHGQFIQLFQLKCSH